MVDVTANIYQGTADTAALTLLAGEALNLAANAGIFAVGADTAAAGSPHGVVANGANIMNVNGDIYSTQARGISSADGNHTITIAATGSVFGLTSGITLGAGGNSVTNAGQISSAQSVALSLGGAGSNTINNSGSIIAGSSAAIFAGGTGNTFTNSGTVESGASIFALSFAGTITNTGIIKGGGGIGPLGALTIVNSGSIVGTAANGGFAVWGSAEGDVVTNTGLVKSADPTAIFFSGGNDVYNGQGGGRVIGEVRGGDGNDTLLGGAFVDIFRGDADNDTLNGGGGVDFLDGGAGNDTYQLGADASDTLGDASGTDTVTSTITRSLGTWAFIENLILQGNAAINGTGNAAGNSIVGNGMNNMLAGQAGNDVLVAGGGNDQLFGQADKDSLTGSAGNDRFGFQTVAHTAAGNGDVIVDFDDSGDDIIDLSGIPGVTTFVGNGPFTAAGQVRYQQVGANVLVQINTTGPSGAEGEITLLNTTLGNGSGQVNAADFLI